MPHDRLTAPEPEARPQLRIARERVGRAALLERVRRAALLERVGRAASLERVGRAASLECSLAELDALDAAVARVTAGWSRHRRVALALTVQREARQAGQIRGRAAFAFLLARYEHLAQAPPVPEPGRPEPERQLPVAQPDAPSLQPARAAEGRCTAPLPAAR